MKRWIWIALLPVILAACEEKIIQEEEAIKVSSVALNRTSAELTPGESLQLEATVSPSNATDKKVLWSSTQQSVATVKDGLVTALQEGSTEIVAQCGDKSARCAITVKQHVVAVTAITLDKGSLALEKGQSETLTATVSPSDATDKTVSWVSSDTDVATVDADGKVTAVGGGTAVVTASAGACSADCSVSVTVPVESLSLNLTSLTLEVGSTGTLSATVNPSDATDQTVGWESSDATVATVKDGLVTALKEGSAEIVATCGGKSARCAVTVKKNIVAVTSVTLDKTSLALEKGKSATLTATVSPSDATDKTVNWVSSDTAVATVDPNGRVTAIGGGSAVITASAGNCSASCSVSVTVPVESVSLNLTTLTLETGTTGTLTATVNPSDATDKTVSWVSSDNTVASVQDGLVTALSEGRAEIVATCGGKSARCAVTVKQHVVAVESITLSKTSLELQKGKSETLTATVSPSDATDKTVNWVSSDTAVAAVDPNGKVTAVGGGSAVITASAGNCSARCSVSVTVPVESVSLNLTTLTLEEGGTTTLTATVNPSDATDKTVSWVSSDNTVATVKDGFVTALKEGRAEIVATCSGKSARCAVTVKQHIVAVESVTLNKTSLALQKGKSETLTATVSPSDATDKTVNWVSSDTSVATVDQSGKVTAVGGGNAVITASAGNCSASCSVSVTVPVESVSLNLTSLTLEEGSTATLTATVNPSDATDKTISWGSSDNSVATVQDGFVTALKEGSASVTATCGGKSATCTVKVEKQVVAVESIALNKTSLELQKGKSETLTATVSPSDATDKTVNWVSSDTAVATVDQNGKVTAVGGGDAVITASAGNYSASCSVSVTVPVERVSLNLTSLTLEEGGTATLTATVDPVDATDKTVIWSSSHPEIASVQDGFVTALKEGSASITATCGGRSATCAVKVEKQVVAVESITLSKTTLELQKGKSETLTATVSPSDATDKTVNWVSSDTSVATVDQNGKVTAVGGGSAVITASAGNCSASCSVSVTVPLESIALNTSTATLRQTETLQLSVIYNPSDTTVDRTVTWTSSNPNVVTVSGGLVSAVQEGTAVVTAQVGDAKATCSILVSNTASGSNEDMGSEEWN